MCSLKTRFIIISIIFLSITFSSVRSEEKTKLIQVDWSFKGITGKFDRSSLQRGYQVYAEVCASCHSMNLVSYRNLGEPGGPEFSLEQVKAIADLPSKEELIGQAAGLINSITAKIAIGINQVPTSLGRGVNEIPNSLGRAFAAVAAKKES